MANLVPKVDYVDAGRVLKAPHHALEDRSQHLGKVRRLFAELRKKVKTLENILPVGQLAEQRDGRDAARYGAPVGEVLLHGAHEQDGGHAEILMRGGGKRRHDPVAQGGILDVAADLVRHVLCHLAHVDRVPSAYGMHRERLLALVLYEEGAQLLGMRVDEEAQLRQDAEPDVLGPDREMVVRAVGVDGGVDEAVGGLGDGCLGKRRLVVRRLQDFAVGFEFVIVDSSEKLACIFGL